VTGPGGSAAGDQAPDPARDPVHGAQMAAFPTAYASGGWCWNDPRDGEHFRRCSYCGSIHPDDLAAESDWHADWADWKYGWPHKFYVKIASRVPGRRYVVAATNRTEQPGPDWIRGDSVPDDVADRGVFGADGWVQLGTRPTHHPKFYTAHLADPQVSDNVRADIELVCGLRFDWNGGRVSWRPAR
jgi:hypothetical protein